MIDAFLSPADELPGNVLKAPKQGVPQCRPFSPSHRGKMICFLFPDVSQSCHLQFQGLTLSQPDVRRHPRSEGEDCLEAEKSRQPELRGSRDLSRIMHRSGCVFSSIAFHHPAFCGYSSARMNFSSHGKNAAWLEKGPAGRWRLLKILPLSLP